MPDGTADRKRARAAAARARDPLRIAEARPARVMFRSGVHAAAAYPRARLADEGTNARAPRGLAATSAATRTSAPDPVNG